MIAALFVAKGGCYFGLPDVDPWDVERDARLYAGPWPVVAHPPCARWCQLAGLVEARYPHLKRCDDGGCFESALASVRRWGGVLEHPAYTAAWPEFGLLTPQRGVWARGIDGGWVTEISQTTYGHRARKLTWLYYVGEAPPAALDRRLVRHTARISWCENHGETKVEVMNKKERAATPLAFRDVLLSIARSAQSRPAFTPLGTTSRD